MIANKTTPASGACRGLRNALPVRPVAPFTSLSKRSNVLVRFRENERPASAADVDQLEEKIHKGKPTDTTLTPEQINEVRVHHRCGETFIQQHQQHQHLAVHHTVHCMQHTRMHLVGGS